MAYDNAYALNAVCPYFTMFPLEYPTAILRGLDARRAKRAVVADPFCGRGTTLFAARLYGLPAYGIDVTPVAVAIARAKLATCSQRDVETLVDDILDSAKRTVVPRGRFWHHAFHPDVLRQICQLRTGLLSRRHSSAAVLLRAVILGALHGPTSRNIERAAYFSNQMPRTFAAKPAYAVRYWRERRLRAPRVDVRSVIRRRLARLFESSVPHTRTSPADVQLGDSRLARPYARISAPITHVITSPPYYGLKTYAQDQWLREWFLGADPEVPYGRPAGLDHHSPDDFAESLGRVWTQIGDRAADEVRLYVRFGAIGSRPTSPMTILRDSLAASDHSWKILSHNSAATAVRGKRQASLMNVTERPRLERDYVIARG